MSDDEMLALDTTTGLVHEYGGTTPGGIGSEKMGYGIGIIPCGCKADYAELFEEAVQSNSLMMIYPRQLEIGIWKPAPCLVDSEHGGDPRDE